MVTGLHRLGGGFTNKQTNEQTNKQTNIGSVDDGEKTIPPISPTAAAAAGFQNCITSAGLMSSFASNMIAWRGRAVLRRASWSS